MAKKKGESKKHSHEDDEDIEDSDDSDDDYTETGAKSKHKSNPFHEPDRAGLRLFLILLIIIGLFIPISAYVESRVTSELNVRYSVTNMAKNLCEQETKNPATSCTSKTLPSTEFNEGYTYKDMIDDTVNLVYYGGGRATDHMTNAQKAYVSMWRLKNFHEYSFYLYFVGILFIIGLIALVALFYHKGPVLASSLNSSLNITLFLLFMWHAINFAFWVGYIPQVLSKIARTSGESLRALVFGADFGFSLSKLHLFVAVISLVLFIIIIIVRRARSR